MIRERSEMGSENRRLKLGKGQRFTYTVSTLPKLGESFSRWNMSLPTAILSVQSRGNVPFPTLVSTVAKFIVPDWGDRVVFGIGLSYWPARLHRP
jgi:hypothetical protein